jgi:hypothetical protein
MEHTTEKDEVKTKAEEAEVTAEEAEATDNVEELKTDEKKVLKISIIT